MKLVKAGRTYAAHARVLARQQGILSGQVVAAVYQYLKVLDVNIQDVSSITIRSATQKWGARRIGGKPCEVTAWLPMTDVASVPVS